MIGPVARDGAVVYDEIAGASELPVGLRDRQAPGAYRLEPTGSPRAFDVVNGPGSLKRFYFAPREPLLQIETRERSFTAQEILPPARKIAVLGVRACDLAALAIQDRIFLGDRFPDPWYAARRRDSFLVAVSCTHSAPSAPCPSAPRTSGPELLALPEDEARRLAETAIRSYDPCISCSAHFLRLSIEERAACERVYPELIS